MKKLVKTIFFYLKFIAFSPLLIPYFLTFEKGLIDKDIKRWEKKKTRVKIKLITDE